MRASDAERERVAKLLESAAAEGRLTPDEAGERLATASKATYREDLDALVADLPMQDDEPERLPTYRGTWFVWGAMRLAVFAMLMMTFWGFWGMRLLLWPLGFMALAFFFRPWRRRRWGFGRRRWQRWQRVF